VVADTTPRAARGSIEGTIFEGSVDDAQLPQFAQANRVISAVLSEGTTNRVRVYVRSGQIVPAGFAASAATLEDAYLVLMRCAPHELPPDLVHAAPVAAVGGAA
jgi:hypothetical protein